MTETRELAPHPPVRFRKNINQIEHMEVYTKPTGPLPLLDLNQTSLIAASNSPVVQNVRLLPCALFYFFIYLYFLYFLLLLKFSYY